MSGNNLNISPDVHYDDGVVCFGPVTENELERHKKLPRYTAVPSDIILRYYCINIHCYKSVVHVLCICFLAIFF